MNTKLKKITGYYQENIACPRCKGQGFLAMAIQESITCNICLGKNSAPRGLIIKRLKREIRNIDETYEEGMKKYLEDMLNAVL